jgi:hypothetical protein
MNTFPLKPLASFHPRCRQCGTALNLQRGTERIGVEVKPEDRMICPVHGDVMSVQEMRRMTFDDNRDEVIEKARDFARDSLRDAFKK